MTTPPDNEVKVAIELARLQGSVEAVIAAHEHRISTLEATARSAGGRFAQAGALLVSVAAFLFVVLDRIQWEG